MAVSVLLCDSMCKRVTCCMAGVHLSVHHVHVLHRTAKDIVKLLSIILVSCYLGSQPCHPVLPNSKRKPLSGGVKYRGGWILQFLTEVAICLAGVSDRPPFAMERQ